MDDQIQQILERFPFLSVGTFQGVDYLGIIQNSDSSLVSMYIYDIIPTEDLRARFLELGAEWWWGSNRLIPINIFFKDQFLPFRPSIRHFGGKDFTLKAGHAVSLQETISKRIRRKQITLVRPNIEM